MLTNEFGRCLLLGVANFCLLAAMGYFLVLIEVIAIWT